MRAIVLNDQNEWLGEIHGSNLVDSDGVVWVRGSLKAAASCPEGRGYVQVRTDNGRLLGVIPLRCEGVDGGNWLNLDLDLRWLPDPACRQDEGESFA